MDNEGIKALTTLIDNAGNGISSLQDALRHVAKRHEGNPVKSREATSLIDKLEHTNLLISAISLVLASDYMEQCGKQPTATEDTMTFGTSHIIDIHDATEHKPDSGETNHDTP